MKDTQNPKPNNDLSIEQLMRRGCLTFVFAFILMGIVGTSLYISKRKARATIKDAHAKIEQTTQKRNAYMMGDFVRNNEAAHEYRDSLNTVNWNLYNIAAEKYFDRIDKHYTLAQFFNARDIALLNKSFRPYMESMAGESSFEYKFVKSNMPLHANTTLSTFLDIIGVLHVDDPALSKMGVLIEDGCLYMFTDKRRQNLFDSFVNDYYAGMMNEYGPNFKIREFANIRNEYTRNTQNIDSLNNTIYASDSVINAKLKGFDHEIDSFNKMIITAQQKLSR